MPLDEGFKRIRNQLAKLDLISLTNMVAQKLHWAETKGPADFKGWLPWRLLVILKWGFEYCGGQYPPRLVNEQVLMKLMGLLHEYEGESTHPFLEEGTIEGIQRFLRTLAHQQFWLQQKLGRWEIGRQHLLFCNLPPEHSTNVKFTSIFGISMSRFLELSVVLWTWLAETPRNVTFTADALFANLEYPQSDVASFLSSIALTQGGVQDYLKERKQAIRNPYFQLVEQTPFIRYPLLRQGDSYLIYSRRVFESALGSIFYDVMKEQGGSAAAEDFGEQLERYVERGLAFLATKYCAERELTNFLPGIKVTDFVLPFQDCTVLIEVKAVEIRQSVRAYPASGPLATELEDSVVKAVIQGNTIARALIGGLPELGIPIQSDYFLLVVTYRDMYLGPGQAIWNEFLRDPVMIELQQDGFDAPLLPPSRIAVLAVDEFDQLISVISTDPARLPAILRKMEADNASFQTAKLHFSQHLEGLNAAGASLPYLDNEFRTVIQGILGKFKNRPPRAAD